MNLYKKIVLTMSFLVMFFILNYSPDVQAASDPYDVESSVKNNWSKILGGKDFQMETGKNLVYDIYNTKYTKNGYTIISKNFGKGKKKYIRFRGWSVLFGHKHHTTSNHETYIVAKNVDDSKDVKVYGTLPLNLKATEDLEYNKSQSTPTTVWNKCANSVTNVSNMKCNMTYEKVGFDAYLPIDELFPDIDESKTWQLYIVKRVGTRIVYTELVVPFEFDNLAYGNGDIKLTSGVNARKLILNSINVIRRTSPRSNETGSANGYFTTYATYTSVTQDEKQTAIWFGVKSPKDGNAVRWASSSYWNFGGDQAKLSYNLDKVKVTVKHIDANTKKVLLSSEKKLAIGASYSYSPKKKGYFEDKKGNPYVPLDTKKTGKVGSKNITITFNYTPGVPDPSTSTEDDDGTGGKVSGEAYWELRRTDATKESKLYAQSNFSIAGEHYETRNVKNILVAGSKTSTASTAKITTDIEDLDDEDVEYNFSYEYTNFYKDEYKCSETVKGECVKWTFVKRTADWTKGKTFSLAKSVGKSMVPITTKIVQNNTVDEETMDEVLSEKWNVGRSDVWTANKKTSKNFYEQWVRAADNNVKTTYNLKTQTTLPLTPGTWLYEIELPSKSHLQQSFNPLKKERSSGYYLPVDLDESLTEEYQNNTDYDTEDYAIPLQQSAFVDKGTVGGKRVFEWKYTSDLFFMGAYTGFSTGYPYAEKIKESLTDNKSIPSFSSVVSEGKDKLANAYSNTTGESFIDNTMFTDSSNDLEKLQRYAIPVSSDSYLKPGETYKNHLVFENMGLNDGIFEFNQAFSFEHYLFGSISDDAWIVEQPDSKVNLDSTNNVHSITIKNKDKEAFINLIKNRPADRVHNLRRSDLDFAEKIKSVIKGE